MSQSGQQHPKADSGGQRPAEDKKAGDRPSAKDASVKQALDAGKPKSSDKDAKK